jgi:V/A-type H+-transporting ATPase subunit I
VIIRMARVRIAGPRAALEATLAVLQDVGALHVVPADRAAAGSAPAPRLAQRLGRMLADVERSAALLGEARRAKERAPVPDPPLPAAARFARRIRRKTERLERARSALEDERMLLLRYRAFFEAFESFAGLEARYPGGRAFYLVLRPGAQDAAADLERSLEAAVSGRFELRARTLASGETALVLLASAEATEQAARLLAEARLEELPAPAGLGELNLLTALPALRARLEAIPGELELLDAECARLAAAHRAALERLRARLHDLLALLEARGAILEGPLLFVIEGWLPVQELDPLAARIARELGPELLVERAGVEPWVRVDAPVALSNPRLFRPFELITRTLPVPRYGSIDPTPFVAVFFPMFFGMMLGDAGYGAALAVLAFLLRGRPGTRRRSIAAMAGACAAFSIAFGLLFGEFFGTLGRSLGLRALAFDREEALLPFMGFAVALGAVHVLLGLVLAVIGAWRRGERRQAMGRGVTFLMILLSGLALLAAFEVLPAALFTPAVVAVLAAFPVLVALEGIVAVIELLSAYGHILSYVRIMAIGTASLMLAVVANRMVGAVGSVLVGVLFALLFHLVNFAIGLFGPTIHSLRLHYVEFFGKFFSPGGTPYRPLAHWRPERAAAALGA